MIPEPVSGQTRKRLVSAVQKAPIRLWNMLRRNWPWKLLAVFLALCLWAGLISQDRTLTRERVFSDVPLSVTGAETLRRNNGLIVLSGLESENLNARMRVRVPQREYANVTHANYNPRLDLTRITEPGEQTVRVVTTSSSTYGSVEDITPSTVTVMVDEYVTNYRVPVSISVNGDYPEGFYGGTISRDPSMAAVSGPRTIVDQISHISVEYNASSLSPRAGLVRTAIPIRFIGHDGQPIESDLLEVTSAGTVLRSIVVEQTIYPTKLIPLSIADLTTGEPAEGYRIKRARITPSLLRAAGDEEALNAVEQLFLDSPLDVTGATETFTQVVRARKPAELAYLSSETLTVTVEIEPVVISRTFDSARLSVRGTKGGLRASLPVKTVSLVAEGPQNLLESLKSAKVSAYVDATGLEAGQHELPVKMHVEGAQAEALRFTATPAAVTVTLTEP